MLLLYLEKKGLRQNNIGGAYRKGWRSGERSEGGSKIIAFLSDKLASLAKIGCKLAEAALYTVDF